MKNNTAEIEVRFLNIDSEKLKKRLIGLGVVNHGEKLLKEVIFYDQKKSWIKEGKIVRIRQAGNKHTLAYKHHFEDSAQGAKEIEIEISDIENMSLFLEEIGLLRYRIQEKKRHSFAFNKAVIDFDTWPNMPTYIEIEGSSETHLKDTAEKLGLSWSDAIFENAKIVIEKYYKIPVSTLRFFTFDKIE